MKKDANINNKKVQINESHLEDRVDIYIDSNICELDKVAAKKNNNRPDKLLIIFIVIFTGVLISSSTQIVNYLEKSKLYDNSNKIIEISSKEDKLIIYNDSVIPQKNEKAIIDEEKHEATVENICKLKLKTDNKAKSESKYKVNIRYRIEKNDYDYLSITTDPELYVRFSYSYDNKSWTFINNVLSTTNSTLMPQMGNYYDISGLETTVNVATNYEFKARPGVTKELYWKAETVYRHINDENIVSKKLTATFNVEYIY